MSDTIRPTARRPGRASMALKVEHFYQALLHALAAIGVASLVQAAHAAGNGSELPPAAGCTPGRPSGSAAPPAPR